MMFIQLCTTAVSCWSARLLRLSSFAEAAAALAHDSTVAVRLCIAPVVVALKYVIPEGSDPELEAGLAEAESLLLRDSDASVATAVATAQGEWSSKAMGQLLTEDKTKESRERYEGF